MTTSAIRKIVQRPNYVTNGRLTTQSRPYSVDTTEIAHFKKLSRRFWDEFGDLKALHSLNKLRVPFVKEGILKSIKDKRTLEGISILDVGCGGGILSEPLARLGATVTGIDATPEVIEAAKAHTASDPELSNWIDYKFCTIEDAATEYAGQFDAIVASEIIEHVPNYDTFVSHFRSLLRPNGSVFVTTVNRNAPSWLLGIMAAENVLRIVPPGTHDHNKFVTPEELTKSLNNYGFKIKTVHGMAYNPFTNKWSWSKYTTLNYAVHAVLS